MRNRGWWPIVAVAIGVVGSTGSATAADWGTFAAPSSSPPEVIGGYTRGCLGGAATLPLDGPGYQVMRTSRNRNYGHPDLVRFIEALAARLVAAGHPGLLIGDMAQPRGGPMRSGHRSHQIGLDVDIWLLPKPAQSLTVAERESLGAPSMVFPGGGAVNENWGELQMQALRTAAEAPEVDRIFVNAAIKQAVCDSETGDRGWLRKLRPWWGHDAHFHVRLACPPDQPLCEPQSPVPPGDGCDASLAWWFSAEAAAEAATPSTTPPRQLTLDDLPTACRTVFDGE
jgi:Murein endopeptidase